VAVLAETDLFVRHNIIEFDVKPLGLRTGIGGTWPAKLNDVRPTF